MVRHWLTALCLIALTATLPSTSLGQMIDMQPTRLNIALARAPRPTAISTCLNGVLICWSTAT